MKLERYITPQELRAQLELEIRNLEIEKQDILDQLEGCVECNIAGIRNGCRRHRHLAVRLEEVERNIDIKKASLPMNDQELAEMQEEFEKLKKELEE